MQNKCKTKAQATKCKGNANKHVKAKTCKINAKKMQQLRHATKCNINTKEMQTLRHAKEMQRKRKS